MFAPDGRLWLSFYRKTGSTLVSVGPRSGKTFRSVPLGVIEEQLAIGPDGNVWFAGVRESDHRLVVGYVDASARPHIFTLPLGLVSITGLAAGPDGAVWFTTSRENQDPILGRITTTGAVRTKLVSSALESFWTAPLEPNPNGGLFTDYGAGEAQLAQISTTTFTVRAISQHVEPYVADRAGDIWGFDDDTRQIARVAPTGARTLTSFPASLGPAESPADGTMILGADGNVWFSGAVYQTSGDVLHHYDHYTSILLGEVTQQNVVTTWSAPFVDAFGGPVGETNYDQLLPGPDGRLYAIGHDAPADLADPGPLGQWHLFAITLPDHPEIKAPAIHASDATITHNTARVRLTCTGQSGRYCSGMIRVMTGSKVLINQAYALAPGLSSTHTVDLPAGPAAQKFVITSTGSSSRSIKGHTDLTP